MVTGDQGLSHNRACTWLRRSLSCQLWGPGGSPGSAGTCFLRSSTCSRLVAFAHGHSLVWLCGYFCVLFYWLYLCTTDLGKLQNFTQQMAGSAAMFSSFVIRFRLQHTDRVLYEKQDSRQAKISNHHSTILLLSVLWWLAVFTDVRSSSLSIMHGKRFKNWIIFKFGMLVYFFWKCDFYLSWK